MMKSLAIAACLPLAACVSGESQPPAPPPLAEDPQQPALALLEHVLTGYFARVGASGPTTCAALRPGPLTAEQEEALIARLVRLAPAARCRAEGSALVDTLTGEPAAVVELYDFTCPEPALCRGWVAAPGTPATRYAMRFETGAWRFDSDRRLIAE